MSDRSQPPHLAFLTIADMGDYISDDSLAADELRRRGARVTFLPWDSDPDWTQFDLVVIRTTWDYQERPRQFLAVLRQIEALGVPLHNESPVAAWNMRKTYLRDLATAGVPIVPSHFLPALHEKEQLSALFAACASEEIILKPQVGASAIDTFRLRPADLPRRWPDLQRAFATRPLLGQPFLPRVLSEGEYSLIYLDGAFSHALLKTPQPGDFRSQEEYGGVITAVSPQPDLLAVSDHALAVAGEGLLYGRVDLVRDTAGAPRLMELELIEPALYLRTDPAAPGRFAAAVLGRLPR